MGCTRGKNGRERLTKRADALRVEGRRRRGRPRREDCVTRDWEWEGRKRASDGGWRRQ